MDQFIVDTSKTINVPKDKILSDIYALSTQNLSLSELNIASRDILHKYIFYLIQTTRLTKTKKILAKNLSSVRT